MVVSQRHLALFVAMLVLHFPNVRMAGVPIPISGIELGTLLFGPFLLLNGSRTLRNLVKQPGLVLIFLLIPVFMLISALVGTFTIAASEVPWFLSVSSAESVLQSLRRMAVPVYFLFLLMLVSDRQDVLVAWWGIFVGLILGALFYAMVRDGMLPGFSISSKLNGNYVTQFLGEGVEDSLVFSKRFAGTTGSPTIFAAYVAGLVLLTQALFQRGVLTQRNARIFTVIGLIFMLMTASKSVLAAFVLLTPFWILYLYRGQTLLFGVLLGGIALIAMVLLDIVPAAIFDPVFIITQQVAEGGQSSFFSRFLRWENAIYLIETQPWITLFGHGWQAKAVGYHNEILEIIAGFGVLFGWAMLIVAYFVLPRLLLTRDGYPKGPAIAYVIVLIFSSLFQTIMFNVYLLTLAALWIVVMRAATVPGPREATIFQRKVYGTRAYGGAYGAQPLSPSRSQLTSAAPKTRNAPGAPGAPGASGASGASGAPGVTPAE